MHTNHPYAHRTNKDGTIDSICKKCFATVGTSEKTEQLEEIESKHDCESWRLEVITVVTHRNSGSNS